MDVKKQLEEMLGKETLNQKIRELDMGAYLAPVQEDALHLKLESIRLKPDGRTLAGKKRAAQNRAKKCRVKRQRAYNHRQRIVRWEAAADGNWWPIVRTTWRKRGIPVEITEAEWNVNVSEHIPEGEIIQVWRHDTNRGVSLDNIYLTNNDGVVLFDGKAYHTDML